MNNHIITLLVGIISLFSIFAYLLLKVVNRLTEVNKQLMILVAGKEEKPEHALRALVASAKPPQGNLPGIATKTEKEDKKPENQGYTLNVGGTGINGI